MKENAYQAHLISVLKQRFPGCLVLKNNPNYIQGIPDLTVLYKDTWAFLEVKKSYDEPHQPNQDYYVSYAKEISFGAFIYPENEEEILHDLSIAFGRKREARIPVPFESHLDRAERRGPVQGLSKVVCIRRGDERSQDCREVYISRR